MDKTGQAKHTKNILLVEDEISMAKLISFKLRKEGFEIDTAEDGEIALEKFFDWDAEYDAVVLDLMLPVLDGAQVLKKIRQAGNKTPVLVLSARSQEKDVLDGFKMGADDYLTKPFSPNELITRVYKIMEA